MSLDMTKDYALPKFALFRVTQDLKLTFLACIKDIQYIFHRKILAALLRLHNSNELLVHLFCKTRLRGPKLF